MIGRSPSGWQARIAQIRRLAGYAHPYLGQFLFLSVVSVLLSLVSLLQPWPLKLVIDSVLGRKALPRPVLSALENLQAAPSPTDVLALLASSVVALFAITAALEALSSWLWTILGRRMAYDLAERIFSRLQQRSLAYHSRVGIGDTLTRIGGDSWSVYKLVTSLLYGPAHAAVLLGMMIVLMLQLDPLLTGVALVLTPMTIAASAFRSAPLRDIAEANRTLDARIRSHVQQVLAGQVVVQSFGQEQRELQRFQAFGKEAVRLKRRSVVAGALNGLASGMAAALANALVLGVGAYRGLTGRITVGDLLVFIAYFRTMQLQGRQFAEIYPSFQRLIPAAERLDEILHDPPEVVEAIGAAVLSGARGEIVFERVSFGYSDQRLILRDLSLRIEPGETLAVVGPTGAGKSTLASLIPRFSDPTAGRVLVDGHDVRDLTVASLRDQVSIVLQEPFLFPISIADNIGYGRSGASRSDIEAAAIAANAHTFISRLEDGYDTFVGERGATLSGGECQRIAIARALLKDAPILILDEPTSALDAGTEVLLTDALRRLVRGRTTLIIAHRLSTVQHADRIVVLQDGCIVESGSHRELLGMNGLYARFVALQAALPMDETANAN